MLTWDKADQFAAVMNTLVQPGAPGSFAERYRRNAAAEAARTLDDENNRPIATAVGRLGGTALAFGRAPLRLVRDPRRLAANTPMSWRDHLAWLIGGAAVGAGNQVISDLLTNSRATAGDMWGSIVGGVTGAATRRLGVGRAALVDGFTTSLAQDVFNGRTPSLSRAGQSAVLGRLLGEALGGTAARISNELSNTWKRHLGERLGRMRSTIAGRRPEYGPADPIHVGGGRYTEPDDVLGRFIIESKFGPRADFTPNQKLARQLAGDNYFTYHFLPDDLGRAAGFPGGSAAPHLLPDWDEKAW